MGDNDTRNIVEQSSDKINSVTCASCWDFYIRILLRCTDPCILLLLLLLLLNHHHHHHHYILAGFVSGPALLKVNTLIPWTEVNHVVLSCILSLSLLCKVVPERTMKTRARTEVQRHSCLNVALDRSGQSHASWKSHSTNRIGGCGVRSWYWFSEKR